jgi:uncharacterized Zn-binding protein involved in type VI secretion
MPPAARVGDTTNHPGVLTGPGVPSVVIGGQVAAVLDDVHACAFPPPGGPHPPNPVAVGSTSVVIGGRPAARAGDTTGCGARIALGCPNVDIGD